MRFGFLSFLAFLFAIESVCYADHQLKVGTLNLGQGRKWIALGIPHQANPASPDLDFHSLGFVGQGLDHLDPKFIIEVNQNEIIKVRSFELQNKSQKSELPPLLLELDEAKHDKVAHFFGNSAAVAGKTLGAPISTITVATQFYAKYEENLRKLRASYLMEIVNKALPPFNKFPELSMALSSNPDEATRMLLKLGEALLIRYHPKSNFAGMIAPRGNGDFYSEWRDAQAGKRVENKEYLVRRANEVLLDVVLFDDDFAYVLIDSTVERDRSNTETYLAKFMGLGSSRKGPQEVLKFVGADLTWAPKVPWYLVAFTNPEGPVDLANFIFPGKFGKKLKTLAMREVGYEFGGSLLPLTNWFFQIIRKGIELRSYQHQDTRYLKRIHSYGAVLALTETQVNDPTPLPGISYHQLSRALSPFNLGLHLEQANPTEVLNSAAASLIAEEEKMGRTRDSASSQEIRKSKETFFHRLHHYLYFHQRTLTRASSATRSPCGISQSTATASSLPRRKPIIVFMVDGLRPDRFRQAAELGHLPNLRRLFIDRGIEMESYTPRSLTLPSWSSFLTGRKPDMHGIRSNVPTSRIDLASENFEDPRKDFLDPKNRTKNRAFHRIEEDTEGEGETWFPNYFDRKQAFYNYMPVVKNGKTPTLRIIDDLFHRSREYINKVRELPNAFDRSSALETASVIRKDRKAKLRLIMNWYGSIDEANHYNNRSLSGAYREIDEAVGMVLDAAATHPVLRHATVFLVSDHGHSGGYGPFDESSTVYHASREEQGVGINAGPLLSNTSFSLTEFLAGDFSEFSQYGFVVSAPNSPEPKFDMKFKPHPYQYIYPKDGRSPTALVDSSGDSMAQVYLKKNPQWDRLSFFDLTHFPGGKRGEILNVPADLLNYQVRTLMVTHPGLRERLMALSGGHPVEYFAMPLKGEAAKLSADRLGAGGETGPSTREPVFLMSRGAQRGTYRTALIFTRSDHRGHDQYRYVVIKNFSQNSLGTVSAEVSSDPNDDPLDYLGPGKVISDARDFGIWRTDREWLVLAHRHPKPTAVFSLATMLTLPPKFTDPGNYQIREAVKLKRQSEIPDFLLTTHAGFGFHSDVPLQSDHGGLSREEVRNTLFVSSLDDSPSFENHRKLDIPVFNYDIMPTLLEVSGVNVARENPLQILQGQSFKSLFEKDDIAF